MDAAPPRRRLRLPQPDMEAEVSLEPLPPELLNGILSRLTLRDAVRTSALARAWRRRWESVPSLKFNWGEGAEPAAITDVLERYSCPVIEFRHSRIKKASFVHAERWLRLLSSKEVQTLVLHFKRSRAVHMLSRSIFSCRELTVLELWDCNIPAIPPGFTGFPHLTILGLFHVGFPDGPLQLELLISTSLLLENLCMELLMVDYSHPMSNQLVIRAPKLRSLIIFDLFDHGWQISDLPSLEVAQIECCHDRDFDKLIRGVACARDLEITLPAGNDYILEGLSHPFNNLKKLSLHTSLSVLSSILSVFFLLKNAPKLENLDIKINDYDSVDDEVENDLLNAQWTDDLFAHLICVDMTHMMCKSSEMHFIEFVLSKARRLQEFRVWLDESCPKSNEDAVTELVKYRRVSPRAKVFFRRMDYD